MNLYVCLTTLHHPPLRQQVEENQLSVSICLFWTFSVFNLKSCWVFKQRFCYLNFGVISSNFLGYCLSGLEFLHEGKLSDPVCVYVVVGGGEGLV